MSISEVLVPRVKTPSLVATASLRPRSKYPETRPSRIQRIQPARTEATIVAGLSEAGTQSPFRAHRRFFCQGEPAEYVYRLTAGVAEGYHITPDGRRQIIDFYVPGDIFGIEAGSEYSQFVVAIADGRAQAIGRAALNQLIACNCRASSELWFSLAKRIQLTQIHILRLGRPAEEKVAGFILEMGERLSGHDAIHLPMTRQAIADHLGMTIETVSRTLTQLRQSGIIALCGSRDIVVLDRQRLRRLAL